MLNYSFSNREGHFTVQYRLFHNISQYLHPLPRHLGFSPQTYSALWWWQCVCTHCTSCLVVTMSERKKTPGTGPVRSGPVQSNSRYKMVMSRFTRNTLLSVHCFKSVQYVHRTTTTKRKSQNNCKLEKQRTVMEK